VWYPDRISARGPRGYDEVARATDDDGSDTDEGSGTSGGACRALEPPFGSDVGFCLCGEDFPGCRILYLGFPFPDVEGGVTGTGVAVLDVSVEPDKEDGTLMDDMERGSNGFLALPFNFASSCAFVNLNLAVCGVSVLSLDSLDEDGAGDEGREQDCDREWEGESAGVEGVRER